MQKCQAKYGCPENHENSEEFRNSSEYLELEQAHKALIAELWFITGIETDIFRKTVLMAMNQVFEEDDSDPTEDQVSQTIELAIAFSAAATFKARQMEGGLLN